MKITIFIKNLENRIYSASNRLRKLFQKLFFLQTIFYKDEFLRFHTLYKKNIPKHIQLTDVKFFMKKERIKKNISKENDQLRNLKFEI